MPVSPAISNDDPNVTTLVAAITAIAQARGSDPDGGPVLVGIDGRAGSGKTSLATAAADLLGAPVLHLDDLYPGWDGLGVTPDLLAAQVLKPLREGEPAGYRRYDWATRASGEWVDVPPAPLLIVEGCAATVGPARPWLDLRVWVDADTALRRQRALARDGEMFAPHWDAWAVQEQSLFAADATARRADLTLRTDPSLSP